MQLKPNDTAPHFSLPSAQGKIISLADFPGQTIILYFYPKDNTPGCTIEAQDFTRLLPQFSEKNAVVIGVSPDSPECHQGFIDKEKLAVLLLSDDDHAVASAYGAYGSKTLYGKETQGIIRSTFIIRDGKILHALYNVNAQGHAQAVLEMLD